MLSIALYSLAFIFILILFLANWWVNNRPPRPKGRHKIGYRGDQNDDEWKSL